MQAKVCKVPKKIESCTQKDVELHVQQMWLVSAAKNQLPLLIEDASRPEKKDEDVRFPILLQTCKVNYCLFFSLCLTRDSLQETEGLSIRVNQDTRLDNRVLDLRTPANQAIFRIEAGVCQLFRDILTKKVIVFEPGLTSIPLVN